jgi:peptidyl-prolyl cis-trans isomerase SurA
VREGIRREMIIQRVQQGNVNQRIEITDQEIENYLATEEGQKLVQPEYRIVHALLPLSEDRSRRRGGGAAPYCRRRWSAASAPVRASTTVIGSASGATTPSPAATWAGASSTTCRAFSRTWPRQLEAGETADAVPQPQRLPHRDMATAAAPTPPSPDQGAPYPDQALGDPHRRQAEEKAAELKARVEAGEDFAALAREYSEDIGSAAEGGDLGWTNPGQMVPEFENSHGEHGDGEISDPVRSQFGWHILEVLDRREKDMTEEMRRAQIRSSCTSASTRKNSTPGCARSAMRPLSISSRPDAGRTCG